MSCEFQGFAHGKFQPVAKLVSNVAIRAFEIIACLGPRTCLTAGRTAVPI
jgi:hypothetical protein